MNYISTRGEAPKLGFEDVLLAGLARDGGLYVPETWPRLTRETIAAFAGRPFAEVAVEVIHPFTGGAISKPELLAMANEAYQRFGHPAVTPLVQIDRNTWILELFHGPTLAFKDVAMQLLARLMDHVLAKRRARATIVGATSGDTGGAAIEAFRGSKRADVIILFPDGRVSDVQRRMMTTPAEANVHAVAIKGTFDDCQALVKGMFNDHAFRDRMALSGVNSINWARIVAQVTYYFVAAAALGAPHRAGHVLGADGQFRRHLRRLGGEADGASGRAPGHRVQCQRHPAARATRTASMRCAASSRPRRRPWTSRSPPTSSATCSRPRAATRRRSARPWARSRRAGASRSSVSCPNFTRSSAPARQARARFRRRSAGCRKDSGYLMDPHTACAWVADEKCVDQTETPRVILSTAHPAKFPDAMERITGERPALPKRLAALLTDKERYPVLANDLAAVEAHVASVARAVSEGAA